jgi:hypothetical protein
MFNLFSIPVYLVLAGIGSTFYLSRRYPDRRPLFVVLSYLFFVAIAMTFAILTNDEFGYRFIPALMITVPWYFLGVLPTVALPVMIVLGITLNCAILYSIVRFVSHAKHSNKFHGDPLP